MENKRSDILAVVQKSDHSLGFYQLTDGAELARVELGHYPHEFVVSADGGTFYVSEYGVQSSSSEEVGGNHVLVFDVAERRIVRRLDCGAAHRPHGIACDDAGDLYVLCESANQLLVKRAAQTEGNFDETYDTGGEKGHMLAVKSDGSRAFFMNIASHTVTTVDLTQKNPTPSVVCEGRWPEGFCFNQDESLLFVGNRAASEITVIDTVRLEKTATIPVREAPLRLLLDPHGRIICVHFADHRAITVINATSGAEEFVFTPPTPSVFASVEVGGNRAAFSLQDDTVHIYNTESWTCEKIIPTRAEPDVTAFIRA